MTLARSPFPALGFSLAALALSAPAGADVTFASLPVTFSGYAEVYYQYNLNQPENGITNYRGFDNRSQTFSLSNVALDALWDHENIVGRLALQIGSTPSTYYLAEPARAGAAGANATDLELWKYLQQAYVGYRFPLGGGLLVQAGLFLSPIGPESLAVKDSWNYSRSNLFFGLPFYHTGARATYSINDRWSVTLAAYNGWNSVVDGNDSPSVSAQLLYTRPDTVTWSLLYFGGVERPTGAPEGAPWRHLADTHVTWSATSRLAFIAQANAGFERNRFGTSAWGAGAVSARVQVHPRVYLAARGDAFGEGVAESAEGAASPIFWPVSWVASGTATIDVRPHDRVSFRLEYRHDHAAGDMYFGGAVQGDGDRAPFVPNRSFQDTLTLGATSWF